MTHSKSFNIDLENELFRDDTRSPQIELSDRNLQIELFKDKSFTDSIAESSLSERSEPIFWSLKTT